MYSLIKNDYALQMSQGNPSALLRNTLILLILFQLLRFISLKMQHQEFVCPPKGGGEDFFDKRNVTGVDRLVFVIYFVAFGALSYFSFPHM